MSCHFMPFGDDWQSEKNKSSDERYEKLYGVGFVNENTLEGTLPEMQKTVGMHPLCLGTIRAVLFTRLLSGGSYEW